MHFLLKIKARSFNQTTLFHEQCSRRKSIFIHKLQLGRNEVINQRIRTVVFTIIMRLLFQTARVLFLRETNRLKADYNLIIPSFNIGQLPRIYSFNSYYTK